MVIMKTRTRNRNSTFLLSLLGLVIVIGLITGLITDRGAAATGEWTWMSGNDTIYHMGTYGTKGTPAASNVPGTRRGSSTWVDMSDDLWLFGGDGQSSTGSGYLNDLWRYDTTTGVWTWMSGNDTHDQLGTYGAKGTPAASNVPGARVGSLSWRDTGGDFWLFGGYGYDTTTATAQLNDLWRYNTTSGEWTWMSGNNTWGEAGTYGTKGTPAASNVPGARVYSISWRDTSGDFWLFGGNGYDKDGAFGPLNDLWRYNTTSGVWTWMSGNDTGYQLGTYGTKGTPAASNIPGARRVSISWLDTNNDLWLYGGKGLDSEGTYWELGDLWRYDTTSGEWTWMSGSDIVNELGTYGTKGTPAASNIPGAREGGVSWVDKGGDLWLFGGAGLYGYLNDLWWYDISTGEWTWMSGNNTYDPLGTYGTKGTPAASNIPGGRVWFVSWIDAAGDFWIFGGYGKDNVSPTAGEFNDLWRYSTPTIPEFEMIDTNKIIVLFTGGLFVTIYISKRRKTY